MSNKFVQIRFESKKSNESLGMILHNTRKIKPSYLRTDQAHNVENNTIYIFDNDKKKFSKFEIDTKEKITKVNDLMKQQLKDEVIKIKSDTKNFREKKHATTIDSVITLSNDINELYKDKKITKDELNKRFLQSIMKISKELELDILNVSIHYDEKTPHAHVSYRNYYNGKSKSISLKKEYSRAQDIVAEPWNDLGYKRGIKKEITNAKHLTLPEMHKKEIEVHQQKFLNKFEEVIKNKIKNNKKYIFFSDDENLFKDLKKDFYKFENVKLNKSYVKKIKELETRANEVDDLQQKLKDKDKDIEDLKNDLRAKDKFIELMEKQEENPFYLKSKLSIIETLSKKEKEDAVIVEKVAKSDEKRSEHTKTTTNEEKAVVAPQKTEKTTKAKTVEEILEQRRASTTSKKDNSHFKDR